MNDLLSREALRNLVKLFCVIFLLLVIVNVFN